MGDDLNSAISDAKTGNVEKLNKFFREYWKAIAV